MPHAPGGLRKCQKKYKRGVDFLSEIGTMIVMKDNKNNTGKENTMETTTDLNEILEGVKSENGRNIMIQMDGKFFHRRPQIKGGQVFVRQDGTLISMKKMTVVTQGNLVTRIFHFVK